MFNLLMTRIDFKKHSESINLKRLDNPITFIYNYICSVLVRSNSFVAVHGVAPVYKEKF